MNPAWVINRADCRNWYADVNMKVVNSDIWAISNTLSFVAAPDDDPVDLFKTTSYNRPTITVNNDSTVVDRKVIAVMAFRIVWIAYSHPSVDFLLRAWILPVVKEMTSSL